MATKIGPKTVTQRDRSKALVFCIDAAHPDSYAGEPATNLIRTDVDNWSNTGTVFTTITNGGLDGKSNAYRIEDDNTGAYELVATTPSASLSANTQYTLSVWFKQKAASEDTNRPHFRWSAGDGQYMSLRWRSGIDDPVVDIGRSDGDNPSTTPTAGIWETAQDKQGNLWVRAFLSWTTQTDHSGTGAIQFYIAHDGIDSGGAHANVGAETIWCPQLEQSAYPTPVVGPGLTAGSARSASTAVKNISGVGALGTTLTGTFATYGNQLRSKVGSRKVNRGTIAAGHIGGAYWDFDGTDEYINAGTGIMTSEFITISVWIKSEDKDSPALQGIVTNNSTSGTRRDFNINDGGQFQWIQKSYADGRINTSTANGPDEGVWTHAVATSKTVGSDTLSKIYKNGIEVGSNTYSSVTMASGLNDACFIGYLNLSRYFNGEIACVSVWSSCLTDKEIKDIYIAQKGRFGK